MRATDHVLNKDCRCRVTAKGKGGACATAEQLFYGSYKDCYCRVFAILSQLSSAEVSSSSVDVDDIVFSQ